MDRVWKRAEHAPWGQAGLRALRATLVGLPSRALRAILVARHPPLSGLNDRQLRDIGLSRSDVARPFERAPSPELDIYRSLRGRD